MLFEYDVFLKARCSLQERESLVALVNQFVELAEKSRREGLLSLEDGIPNLGDLVLSEGVQLIVNGVDPDIIEEILVTALYVSDLKGKELLKRMMICTGVHCLSMGTNPLLVRKMLEAFIGIQTNS